MPLLAHVPSLDPLDAVHELEPVQLVREVVNVLGRPLVAVLMGAKETKQVAKWENGMHPPRAERERALRVVLQMIAILRPRYTPKAIQSWFQGINQYLDDHSPTETVWRFIEHPNPDVERRLLNASRAFVNR